MSEQQKIYKAIRMNGLSPEEIADELNKLPIKHQVFVSNNGRCVTTDNKHEWYPGGYLVHPSIIVTGRDFDWVPDDSFNSKFERYDPEV